MLYVALVVVIILAIVVFLMARFISENEVSQREYALFHIGEASRYRNILFTIQKAADTEAGGIYKRISENREILEHLNEADSNILSETNAFWLLDGHHQFLLSLVYAMKINDPEFEVYSELHRIDDIEIFDLVGKKLGESPFVTERLNQLKN